MCGRFAQRTPKPRLREEFGVGEVPDLGARANISPTQQVVGVFGGEEGREARLARWGWTPSWAKQGRPMINARAETVLEKPTFRRAFTERRCLVPADGFYEWETVGGRKRPVLFELKDGSPFALAGLWERVVGEDGQSVDSLVILTTRPNELVGGVHDRMPVLIGRDAYDVWLGAGGRDTRLLLDLLRPYPAEEMAARPSSLR